MKEIPKTYPCDPTKNKECNKRHCYIIDRECSRTRNKKYKISFGKAILFKILGIKK